MELLFWFVIIFTLVYEPIVGYFGYQKFKKRLALKSNTRIKYYKSIIVGLWVPTVFILLLIVFTDLTLQDVGITLPIINTETLGSLITYIVLILAAIYFLLLVFYLVGYHFNKSFRRKFIESSNKQFDSIGYADILPVTTKEKKVWTYVSITAGVTEEIIYRGFLIFAFAYLFPNFSIWMVMLGASVLFGLAHSYQGFGNVVKTTIFGYFFSILYIGVGSILPIMVLHFLIDYIAKLGDEEEVL